MHKADYTHETHSNTSLAQVTALRDKMHFITFENGKPYSFDYMYKESFELFEKMTNKLSVSAKNIIPIFLPNTTKRIAFFSYESKSVRVVDITNLEAMLKRQAKKKYKRGDITKEEAYTFVKKDIDTFNNFKKQHKLTEYRQDIQTKTIQFNAYDKNDKILIEKSFSKGGLVFDMKEEEFAEKVIVSYSRHRKRRSDRKNDYLPLQLLKIRGLK
jgi:hypothetical protein